MASVVVDGSSWVVGSMCHCGLSRDVEEPSEHCDDHWDIWVAPVGDEKGRIIVANGIYERETAERIVALHNAALAVS